MLKDASEMHSFINKDQVEKGTPQMMLEGLKNEKQVENITLFYNLYCQNSFRVFLLLLKYS